MATIGLGSGGASSGGERLASLPSLTDGEKATPAVPDAPLNDYLRPLRIGTFAPWQLRSVGVSGGVPTLLSTAAPLRVGLLMCHDGTVSTVGHAGPLRDSAVHPVLWVPGQTTVGGTLGELLSLVTAEWWFTAPTDVTVSLVEFVRPM